MEFHADASLRIVVSGFMKGKATIEDDMRCFFHDAGCKVAAVRLVMDTKRNGRIRGFSFVDLEDHESLDIALKLHNNEATGLAEKDGKLRIEKARVCGAKDPAMKKKQGERKFALGEAKLDEFFQVEQGEVCVRNTFIEVVEPLKSLPMLRRKTVA